MPLTERQTKAAKPQTDSLVKLVCRIHPNTQCQCSADVHPCASRKDLLGGARAVHGTLRAFFIRTTVAAQQTADSPTLMNGIVRKINQVS